MSSADPQRLRRHIGVDDETPILLVLPGSRPSEIARMTPPFQDAIARLTAARPDLRVVAPVAPTVAALVKATLATWRQPPDVVEGDALKLDAMAAATVALACSGSVTTELALLGCPMVVAYRVGPLTYGVLKRLVTTRFITLFNIAVDAPVAPEFIQDACTGERLASALADRLDNPRLRRLQAQAQLDALQAMGRDPSLVPAERAADAVLAVLQT